MKKITTLLAVAACALAAAGCSRNNVQYSESDTSYRVSYGAGIYTYVNVWTDPDTGCESYVTDDGFMSPRLNADGMQRCNVPAGPPVVLRQ